MGTSFRYPDGRGDLAPTIRVIFLDEELTENKNSDSPGSPIRGYIFGRGDLAPTNREALIEKSYPDGRDDLEETPDQNPLQAENASQSSYLPPRSECLIGFHFNKMFYEFVALQSDKSLIGDMPF